MLIIIKEVKYSKHWLVPSKEINQQNIQNTKAATPSKINPWQTQHMRSKTIRPYNKTKKPFRVPYIIVALWFTL